jgi:hypothetical protein
MTINSDLPDGLPYTIRVEYRLKFLGHYPHLELGSTVTLSGCQVPILESFPSGQRCVQICQVSGDLIFSRLQFGIPMPLSEAALGRGPLLWA